MSTPTGVDDYLAGVPDGPRKALQKLRETIKAAAPDATETIAYTMPAFRLDGRFFVSYAAYKDHCSLFPASEAVIEAGGEELAPHVAGKGTIQFKADDPLSAALVRKIVKARLRETRGPNAAR